MKIAVIGATGYLGGAIYARAGCTGNVVGTNTTGNAPYVKFALNCPADFDYGSVSPGDTMLLTAGISAPDVCANEHQRAWDANVTGTAIFIERALERRARVVFFSSDTVYGEQASRVSEETVCAPAGEYAAMKHAVERRFQGNPHFKSIRLSYVFSRDDKFTTYLAQCVRRNEEAEIFHPFCRAVVHRNDIVEGALALARRWDEFPQPVINFGGPEVLSRKEFADVLRSTVFPSLRYRVTEPDAGFFKNRPRVIMMASPHLEALLGRRPRTLREAALVESFDARDRA